MSATDSIPPEDPSLRTQVRALAFQTEGLTRLLLGLESANRELIGEVRADRQARAQPHPLSSAVMGFLQSLGSDVWVRRAVAGLIFAVAVWLLASVENAPGSPLTGIFSLADHYLSPGSKP